jgi:hypothetical protein
MNKTFSPAESLAEIPFRIDSISPAGAPEGSDGEWFRYVIVQGTNKITGVRAGTSGEINVLVQQMVDGLNERFGKQRAKLKKR